MKNRKADRNESPARPDRRRFLILVGNSAVALAGVGSAVALADFLMPGAVLEDPTRFKAATVDMLPPNSMLYNAEYKVYLFREDRNKCYALSGVCTHLGCTVRWNPEGTADHPEGVMTCPCHGSVFSRTGNVLQDPAVKSLSRFHIETRGGKVLVDVGKTVDEQGMMFQL